MNTIGTEKIKFHGTFRDYQQRVLDHANTYLRDGRINIVAAPGSGKTVLGLELIRRIGKPCIVLSPTTAIREQWKARFRDLFLADKENLPELFSTDLHNVKFLNSITYQALYTALEKEALKDEEDDSDISDIDIFATMKSFGIKTICLDEAHHLKNEWQKALEKFIGLLDKDVKIISLTATPPYDSDGSEWSRYLSICGEIDEEIFVPELVGQNTLCPHQDYIYFNYPTESEEAFLSEYKENAHHALEEIGKTAFIHRLYEELNNEFNYERFYASVEEYISLLILFEHYGLSVRAGLIKALTTKASLPKFKLNYAEKALQFLVTGDILAEAEKEELCSILKKHSVYDKRKVALTLNEKLKRTLISSVGKLESIKQIAKSEYASMGEKLRMLVLTDYIKKENVERIANGESFNSINVVSIFDTIRRENDALNIGVLSGTLVILPEEIDLSAFKHKKQSIPSTRYCVVEFSGSNHNAVDIVGKLFESGRLQVLVGTKSLLGEGWDSPCINSLVLASFVGSFVLSNQMRGRAIRIDKANPEKAANIWHLVTVEPDYMFAEGSAKRAIEKIKQDKNELISCDFEVLKRRFESFMGPNYSTGKIESGIERITAVKPPFDEKGIESINQTMLALAKERKSIKEKWSNEVAKTRFNVTVESEIPAEKQIPVFTFSNCALIAALILVQIALIAVSAISIGFGFWFWVLEAVALVVFYIGIKKLLLHINPAKSIKTLGKSVFKALQKSGLISCEANVEATQDKELRSVRLQLKNASMHDQNIFNTAMRELLSPIDNPRYILLGKNIFGGYNYRQSFACPTVLGRNKETAAMLADRLNKSTGRFMLVYTHNEYGRKLILRCRKYSYITHNQKSIGKKHVVSHRK